ncbi:MAG TPA: DUF192 domain-containing protein [Candidatus Tumulicola sp.]|jgi:hypothetical protein
MAVLKNVTTGEIIAANVVRANGILSRMVGFITRKKVRPDDGLWYDNCSAIHTIGMKERIDVVFLDKNQRVLRVERAIPRYRFAVTYGARAVVELGEATLQGRDLLAGDELALE